MIIINRSGMGMPSMLVINFKRYVRNGSVTSATNITNIWWTTDNPFLFHSHCRPERMVTCVRVLRILSPPIRVKKTISIFCCSCFLRLYRFGVLFELQF